MKKDNIKNTILILVILLVINTSGIQGQNKENVWQWINTLGSPSWDYVNGIETDKDGNTYIAGAYSGELKTDSKSYETEGKHDLFVAKYNPKGKLQWVWNAGGKQSDKLTALYVNENNELYVSGIITGEVVMKKEKIDGKGKKLILAKLNKRGKLDWIKNFPIPSPASMYQMYQSNNGILVAGTFRKELIIEGESVKSKGKEDIFIARFTAEGKLEKLKSYGGKGKDIITAFAGGFNNTIFLSVNHQGDINFGDYKLASKGQGITGAFITAINSDLEPDWLHEIHGEHYVQVSGIAPTKDNKLYISGNFTHSIQYGEYELTSTGATDFFTAKIDTLGHPLWMKSYGTTFADYASNIELNAAGGIMLNGTFNDTLMLDTMLLYAIDGNATAFVSQIDKTGRIFWAESIGGKNNVTSHHSTIDKQGNILLSGSFSGKISNDEFDITSQGDEDIYIAKYFNCPEYGDLIKGNTYICPNAETELKINGRFDNIVWNNGLFTDEKRISINEPGTYFVEMTDKYACLVQDTIEIAQAPGIEFSLGKDTILYTDESIDLEGPDYAKEYWWYNQSALHNTTVLPNGDFNHAIEAWLQVTDSMYCQTADTILIHFETKTPLIDISQAHDLIIYPNPVTNYLNWSLDCDQKASLYVEITNIEGHLVHQEVVYNYISGQEESIPVRHLPAGNYYLSIGNKQEKITETVVIINE